MKLKIEKNVIHKGTILKKGQVVEVKSEESTALIGGEFATEHKEEAAKKDEPPKK